MREICSLPALCTALIGLLGCNEAGVRLNDNPLDAMVLDAGPDSAVDAAQPDARLPDAALDASPVDAALPTGPLLINEVRCGDPALVEVFTSADAASLVGWRLRTAAADVSLATPERRLAMPFATAELPVHCGVSTVELVDPDGAVVDAFSPELPAVEAASRGRIPDGADSWRRTHPTPGASNIEWNEAAGLFEPLRVHTLRIDLSPEAALALQRERTREVDAALVINGQPAVPARAQIFGPDGRSRRLDQKSGWRLTADLPDLGGLTLDGALLDPAVLTRWLASRMLRHAGVWVPRVGFAALEVDGKPLGLHVFEEPLLPPVLDRWFASTWQVWRTNRSDFLENQLLNFRRLTGPDGDRRALRWAIERLAAAEEQDRYARSSTVVDWAVVTRMLAGEAWIGSTEGYGPARRLLRVHFDLNDQLRIIPDGLDRALRTPIDPYAGSGLLWQICRDAPDCQALYDAAIIEITDRLAEVDWLAELNRAAAVLRPFVATDPQSYWSPEDFDREVARIAAFLMNRTTQMQAQARCLETEEDTDGDGRRCAADCAPDDPTRFVGAVERCNNGIDDNCSGTADDGLVCDPCEPISRGAARYLVCARRVTYRLAEIICEDQGAVPLKIDSASENTWVHRTARGVSAQDFWIGLTDRETEGEFVWADGTSDAGYSAWGGGEPNDFGTGEDCTHYRGDGLWNDANCDGARGVICELPCAAGDADGDGADDCHEDCDATDPNRHPGAEDVCDDGIDQDCDGFADEGCGCSLVPRDGRVYRFCPAAVTYAAAEETCADEGMRLVEIDSPSENAWLWQTARSRAIQRWWIGLSDRDEEGAYRTLDGRRPEFGAWRRGEPNDGGRDEDCIHFWENAPDWNDARCTSEHGTICEPGCVPGTDVDGDGASGCGADCDDDDPSRAPGLIEACNAVDDDCDGQVDERCVAP